MGATGLDRCTAQAMVDAGKRGSHRRSEAEPDRRDARRVGAGQLREQIEGAAPPDHVVREGAHVGRSPAADQRRRRRDGQRSDSAPREPLRVGKLRRRRAVRAR
jgi:hypothetical protein